MNDDAVARAPAGPEPELSLTVGGDDAGTRLDRFLAQPLGSRSHAVALIDAGRVTVDGAVRQKRYALEAGSVVVIAAADASGRRGGRRRPTSRSPMRSPTRTSTCW